MFRINNLSVNVKPFTQHSYQSLRKYSYQTRYVEHLRDHELELYQNFSLLLFYDEIKLVGYALVDNVLGGFFYEADEHEEIMEVISEKGTYSYIAYFEIFEREQGKGYGNHFLKYIKEQFSHYPLIVFASQDSVGFWVGNEFKEANYSDWWLIYQSTSETSLKAV